MHPYTRQIASVFVFVQSSNRCFINCVHSFSTISPTAAVPSTFSGRTSNSYHRRTTLRQESIFSLFATVTNASEENSSTQKKTYEKSKQPTSSSDSDNDTTTITTTSPSTRSSILQQRKRAWINQSLTYYATVSREAKRREKGQFIPFQIQIDQHKSNFITAKKLYFARHKIKKNQPHHAERIYRKLIDDLVLEQQEEGQSCDHAQIAISTLLLALLLQRQGKIKETRAIFIRFFRLITMQHKDNDNDEDDGSERSSSLKECTCSAKVLQAFALFEMKQCNPRKAYNLIQMAVELDQELKPVLQWKQFRDAKKLVTR